ncbi:hypothetical protein [Promicromonospora sp. NFX87]|uniref:hypothetical protein n=1 Tax=Promicromonospora sp. NFX87 TaxID=3402691 RepID=UPI003AFA7E17
MDNPSEVTPDQNASEETATQPTGFIDSHVENQTRRFADHIKRAEALYRKLPGVRKNAG